MINKYGMDKRLREYFRKIGRKGGLKKKLTTEQARAMVEAREKKRGREKRK
jgi:hypothetical protein